MTTHNTHTTLSVLLVLADEQQIASDTYSRELSALRVKTSKTTGKATYLSDGGGLSLYISETGSKSWRYRFRLPGQQILTIGTYPEVSLEAARRAHRAARYLVARGEHPRAYVDQKIALSKKSVQSESENTFRGLAERWMFATDSNLAASTVKHRRAMLEKYVLQKIGTAHIATLKRKELQTLLAEIDAEAPVTAKHCRGYISQVFEYAEDLEIVDANPTPRAKALSNATSRRVVPRKMLAASKIGDFLLAIQDASETDPNTKLAMKLLLYTWCRTSEVVAARWKEVDLENETWTIEASRMKAREAHTVRLSTQAAAIFKGMKSDADSDTEYVFENRRRSSGHMCRMTLTNWRKRHGFADLLDMHGLRATASTWANESGCYRSDVIEVALAHKESDRVKAAYNRAKFIEELKILWQDWADFCDKQLRLAIAKKQQDLSKCEK